ncbi:coiled-coil domain-containing protein 152-like [Trichomycterus rosablanca]|uniref:coiled-coil domain-containing protein 152-like n=1 Tax=Trichomycterus rosablanca TaxID=2290929 RepID=UPI002F35E4F4
MSSHTGHSVNLHLKMKKTAAVNLDKLIQGFSQLEQKITELKGKNNMLEIKLDETNRLLKFSQNKEKHLTEEKEGLMATLKNLQQNLQQQCELRVENEKLKNGIFDLRKQNEAQVEETKVSIQKLQNDMRSLQEQHKNDLADCAKETQRKLECKDAEMQASLDRKEDVLEEMRRKIKEQQKEKQSEIIKLQMEFSAKLARAQSMSVMTQQQPRGPGTVPQNLYKRKLQFLQEEKNKEIESLRLRVKELEQQNLRGFSETRLKRKKM